MQGLESRIHSVYIPGITCSGFEGLRYTRNLEGVLIQVFSFRA